MAIWLSLSSSSSDVAPHGFPSSGPVFLLQYEGAHTRQDRVAHGGAVCILGSGLDHGGAASDEDKDKHCHELGKAL